MNAAQGAARLAARLGACSECCLDAAERLADAAADLALPRALLLQAAVEFRLKAFLVAARGGAPATRDLSRLAGLALRCGLRLGADHLGLLDDLGQDPAAMAHDRPATPPVRCLCRDIEAQQH